MTVEYATEDAAITVDPTRGGRLTSLTLRGNEVLVTTDTKPLDWGCYPMVPWAGRVRGGRFTWDGKDVALPLGAPPHAIHGTVSGRRWRQTGPTTFTTDFGPHWPWPGSVESTFKLTPGQLRWRLTVRAEEAMPITMGWHPWFLRYVDGMGAAELRFDAPRMYQRDAAGMPTGDLVMPPPGPWDDCFTGLTVPPRITYANGSTLEISSSCDHWVVYDERDHAFCVEPQSGPPDAFNLCPTEVAKPGVPVSHHLLLRWCCS